MHVVQWILEALFGRDARRTLLCRLEADTWRRNELDRWRRRVLDGNPDARDAASAVAAFREYQNITVEYERRIKDCDRGRYRSDRPEYKLVTAWDHLVDE